MSGNYRGHQHKWVGRNKAGKTANTLLRSRYSPREIASLVINHPELRLPDNAANLHMARLLMVEPEDAPLQELMNLTVETQTGRALVLDDPFLGNYPAKDEICYPADFCSFATMVTGDPVGLVVSQLTGNVLLIGPTKSAKTSLIAAWLISSPGILKTIRIIVFAKKRELRHLATIPHLHDLIMVVKLGELALCYFQPPPGVPEEAWNNESTRIVGQCYGRYSAQRLMGDKVAELMANHPQGLYPTLRQLVEVLDAFKPRFGMREAAYKESILWVLRDLVNCTGGIWDHSYSNFLEHLYSEPGLCVIEAAATPQEHLTFIITYFMRWLYLKRVYAGEEVL